MAHIKHDVIDGVLRFQHYRPERIKHNIPIPGQRENTTSKYNLAMKVRPDRPPTHARPIELSNRVTHPHRHTPQDHNKLGNIEEKIKGLEDKTPKMEYIYMNKADQMMTGVKDRGFKQDGETMGGEWKLGDPKYKPSDAEAPAFDFKKTGIHMPASGTPDAPKEPTGPAEPLYENQ